MAELTCILGKLTGDLTLPSLPLAVSGKDIREHFSIGSDRDIDLIIDESRLNEELYPGRHTVEAFYLHKALKRLTQNPSNVEKVDRIGVVFAGRYKHKPDAFGVMFDEGYPTKDDQDFNTGEGFTDVPREGCAVFLGAIAAARHRPDDYAMEVAFTTIHELGHIFNLHHEQQPVSFLSTSPDPGMPPFGKEAHQFGEDHKKLLRTCSISRFVWPGGSQFDLRGDPSPMNLPLFEFGLELSISMEQREFWYFEPIELDVHLSIVNGVDRNYEVPDMIDPGYEEFVIWIEDPMGERRRYRSPRKYCVPYTSQTITPRCPFERDISIFLEAGGYTFRRTGMHRLWATFAVPGRGTLESNRLSVNVLPGDARNESYRDARGALGDSSSAKLLYHRIREPRSRSADRLMRYCDEVPDARSHGAIRYAVGRALLTQAENAKGSKVVKRLEGMGIQQLEKALDQPGLSRRRRLIAKALIGR